MVYFTVFFQDGGSLTLSMDNEHLKYVSSIYLSVPISSSYYPTFLVQGQLAIFSPEDLMFAQALKLKAEDITCLFLNMNKILNFFHPNSLELELLVESISLCGYFIIEEFWLTLDVSEEDIERFCKFLSRFGAGLNLVFSQTLVKPAFGYPNFLKLLNGLRKDQRDHIVSTLSK